MPKDNKISSSNNKKKSPPSSSNNKTNANANTNDKDSAAPAKTNDDQQKQQQQATIDAMKKELKSLKGKVGMLEHLRKKHQITEKEWRKEKKELQKVKDERVYVAQVHDFLAEFGGLSRYTLVNDDWHAHHPTAANTLLGFESWEHGKAIMAHRFPELRQEVPKLLHKKQRGLYLSRETTNFERCVAVKMVCMHMYYLLYAYCSVELLEMRVWSHDDCLL